MLLPGSFRRWLLGGLLVTVAGLGQFGAQAGSAFPDEAPKMTPLRKDVKPFEYVEAKVPFYPPGEKWGTIGKPITRMQLPVDAEESIKHMVTPVEFEVQLFAS
jgi:uncharacterized protein